MDPLAELRQIFFQECDELLLALEAHLRALNEGSEDPDDINGAFRAIHSVKGGASAFGFPELVDCSHAFEAALDQMRAGRLSVQAAPMALFLRAADTVADLVAAARNDTPGKTNPELIAQLYQVARGEEVGEEQPAASGEAAAEAPASSGPVLRLVSETAEPQSPRHSVRILLEPDPDLFQRVIEPATILSTLCANDDAFIIADLNHVPPLEAIDPQLCYMKFFVRLETEREPDLLRQMLELWLAAHEFSLEIESFEAEELAAPASEAGLPATAEAPAPANVEKAAPPPAAAPPAPAAAKPDTPPPQRVSRGGSIRVDLDRIDTLMNLAGEIVITQSMLMSRADEMPVETTVRLAEGLQMLTRQTRALQDSVMAVRAQPVRTVFQRMPRLVRELGDALGKQVRLNVRGENTEVDKTIIEELSDPLTHMIRNAMDHGLETREERVAAGKPVEGTIALSADQRGGRIVITLQDDGRGINRARVLEKAVARGVIEADARPTPEEIDALIFHPGLSTADKVTDISGRGVGMDVVKRNVEHLGGRITVVSEPGRGSIFTLSLPLTLAVLDGMIVRCGHERFVLPTASVVETMKYDESMVEELPGGHQILRRRGEVVPLTGLGPLLGMGDDPEDPVIVLAETDIGRQIALTVEEIIGQQQVVVKSLESSFGRVEGVSAATILGNGLVALIVDVDTLPRLAARLAGRRSSFNQLRRAS